MDIKAGVYDLFAQLRDELESVNRIHPEVEDTAVRYVLSDVVLNTYVNLDSTYTLQSSFAMYTRAGDEQVGAAVERYFDILQVLWPQLAGVNMTERYPLLRQMDAFESMGGMALVDFIGIRLNNPTKAN